MTVPSLRHSIVTDLVHDGTQSFSLKRGQQINHLPDYWIVKTGIVRSLTWDEEGEVRVLGVWGPGNLVSQSLSQVNPYQLDCLEPALLERLPNFTEFPKLLIERQKVLETMLNISQYRSIPDRTLQLLYWLADRFGYSHQQPASDRFCMDNQTAVSGAFIPIKLTHQQLAEMASTTRVTMTRLLNLYEQDGTIFRLKRGYILLTEQALNLL